VIGCLSTVSFSLNVAVTRGYLAHSIVENLVVKKVGLFATVFSRADGTESYYFNSQLFSKFMYVINHLCLNSEADGYLPQPEHETKRENFREFEHAGRLDDATD